jgi:hypothetical protein
MGGIENVLFLFHTFLVVNLLRKLKETLFVFQFIHRGQADLLGRIFSLS